MFFTIIKGINRLISKGINRSRKELNRLLSEGINRLTKEISRLVSKGMSNTYLNVTIDND